MNLNYINRQIVEESDHINYESMFNELPGPKDLSALPDEDHQNAEKTSEHDNPEVANSEFRARLNRLHDALQTGEPEKIKAHNLKKVTETQSLVTIDPRFSEMESKQIEILVDCQKMRLYIKSIKWHLAATFNSLGASNEWLNENIGMLSGVFKISNKLGNRPIIWKLAGD